MTKTQQKDAFRNIWKQLSSFLSAVITAGFSLIVNGLQLRKVKTLKLSDI